MFSFFRSLNRICAVLAAALWLCIANWLSSFFGQHAFEWRLIQFVGMMSIWLFSCKLFCSDVYPADVVRNTNRYWCEAVRHYCCEWLFNIMIVLEEPLIHTMRPGIVQKKYIFPLLQGMYIDMISPISLSVFYWPTYTNDSFYRKPIWNFHAGPPFGSQTHIHACTQSLPPLIHLLLGAIAFTGWVDSEVSSSLTFTPKIWLFTLIHFSCEISG